MKKNNILTIIITIIVVGFIGIIIYIGNKNKTNAPANISAPILDEHGHPIVTNNPKASLNDLANKPAPDFNLADKNGKIYSLAELRGKNIILFFNEGLMCYPACWNQIVSFANDERFKKDDIVVLSVVVDSKEEWQKAIDKMPELAKATVVFDNGAAVSKKYGVLTTKSSMHYGSLPGHTYVVIDKEGMVRNIFDDPQMAIRNDKLLEEINQI